MGIITYNGLTGIVTEGDRGLSIVGILGPVVCSRKSDTSRGWTGTCHSIYKCTYTGSPVKGVTLCLGVSIVVVGS